VLHDKWKSDEKQASKVIELPPLPRSSCKYPYQLNKEETTNMKQLFGVFDDDGSGQVSIDELASGFRKLGM
jgi:Ca2+-binding EF-hand superfamily protein